MKFEIEENKKLNEDLTEELECICGGQADLLKYNGEIVGACSKYDKKSKPFEIEFFEIINNHDLRGKGLGTVFIKMYEVMAKERGFTELEAKVEEDKNKINFWENHVKWIKGEKINGNWKFYKKI